MTRALALAGIFGGGVALLWSPAALAGGEVVIDNRSEHTVKVVAVGGQALVEPGAGPTTVRFEADAEIGIDLKVWWTVRPRELCQQFVPWSRTVVVTGGQTIRCRTQ
jgi:hypothetical protein